MIIIQVRLVEVITSWCIDPDIMLAFWNVAQVKSAIFIREGITYNALVLYREGFNKHSGEWCFAIEFCCVTNNLGYRFESQILFKIMLDLLRQSMDPGADVVSCCFKPAMTRLYWQ